jgi:phosphoglycerate dehydrogenase-like enzyme
MRDGGLLLNFSPMGLIDPAALLESLRSRRITFVLDHADGLDPRTIRKMVRTGACRVYPPIGYATVEARAARGAIFVGNVLRFLRQGRREGRSVHARARE